MDGVQRARLGGYSGRLVRRRKAAIEHLPAAIAFSSAYRTLAMFAGPALAGVLLAWFPVYVSFLFNVVGYALYLLMLQMMRLPPAVPAPAAVLKDVGALSCHGPPGRAVPQPAVTGRLNDSAANSGITSATAVFVTCAVAPVSSVTVSVTG